MSAGHPAGPPLWQQNAIAGHAGQLDATGQAQLYQTPVNSLNPVPVTGAQQPPRTTALDDVLSTFDFGDQQAFWEWGAGPGLGSVDWNSLAQAGAMGQMGR